jgi:hypothetical protein
LAPDFPGSGERSFFRRVAMEAPDDQCGHACAPGFERRQVADAGLVPAARVVDDEDVAGLGGAERLQEDVDAAEVTRRKRAAGDPASGRDGRDAGRRRSQRNAVADAGIRHERRGKVGERG